MIDYKLVRTKRKTVALYVRQDGSVEVRAPHKVSKSYIDSFVEKKSDWIRTSLDRISERRKEKKIIRLTGPEVKQYQVQFKEYLEIRCKEIARIMGLQYGKIRVNKAKTILGSCNARADLSFTFRLIFAPKELIDYVIVHELSHIKEMNHSARFWAIVEEIMPDYKQRRKNLKEFQRRVEIITED